VRDLDTYYSEWILKNWGIESPEHWWYTPEYGGRIAMSIRSPKFLHRGWVLRDISGRAKTKALTFIDDNEESLSWYKTNPNAPTVVVEDIPSAVRASMHGVNAVALLGTRMGTDRAIEIAQNTNSQVIITLDNDAVDLSFAHAKRYSLLWGSVSVLPLSKDIKDMTDDEIKELLQ
jgi:predicted nuclease of predicted toxin-antitoxin system